MHKCRAYLLSLCTYPSQIENSCAKSGRTKDMAYGGGGFKKMESFFADLRLNIFRGIVEGAWEPHRQRNAALCCGLARLDFAFGSHAGRLYAWSRCLNPTAR